MSLDDLLDSYLGDAAQAESSGGKNRVNPLSGATGTYQFMPRTWQRMRRKYPELKLPPFEKMDDASERRAVEQLTKENAAALQRDGLPVNNVTLYAMHHFGSGRARNMLKQLAAGKNPTMADIYGADHPVFAQNPKLSPDMKLSDWSTYLQARISGQPYNGPTATQDAAIPSPKPDVGMEADRTRGAPPADQQAFSDAVNPAPAPGQQVAQAQAAPIPEARPIESYQGVPLDQIPPEDIEYVRSQIQRDWTQGKIGTDRYKLMLQQLGTTPDAEAARNGGALPQVVMPRKEMGEQVRRAQQGQGATLVGPDQQLSQLAPQGPHQSADSPIQGPPTQDRAPVIPMVPEPKGSTPAKAPKQDTKKFVPVQELMGSQTNFVSINGKNFRRSAQGWKEVM